MTDIVVRARSVAKTYQQGNFSVPVLLDINLEVSRGELVAVVGSSGTGKSTLLHLLGGLDVPDRGEISLNGNDMLSLNENQRGKLRNETLGFVYQFHHLLPEFTAEENVMMPLLVRRTAPARARAESAKILEKVGLSHRLKHKPGELSGGERQRVAIARALITKPVCLLADEPTGNIDRQNAEKVQDMMVSLDREMRVSLIVATHDEQLASSMDRIVRLDNGVLVEVS